MSAKIWYKNYSELRKQVADLNEAFEESCERLKLSSDEVLGEFTQEILTRAVHESNWQEGLELEKGKTQKFAQLAFDEFQGLEEPSLDMKKILAVHRARVIALFDGGASEEEVGAYNLAFAHTCSSWVELELTLKDGVGYIKGAKEACDRYASNKEVFPLEHHQFFDDTNKMVEEKISDRTPFKWPIIPNIRGDFTAELLKYEKDDLHHPLRKEHIKFLHKIIMMGILDPSRAGEFRRESAHVGNPDVYFSPPAAIDGMMEEFCRSFPVGAEEGDPILLAAQVSHSFVLIHPFEDGNGRLSRVIMNMILFGYFPPVYLKADSKGRHRYSQALRKADRGDLEPLAALICMSLIEIFNKVNRAIARR